MTREELQQELQALHDRAQATGLKIRWNSRDILVIGLPDGTEKIPAPAGGPPVPLGDRPEGRGSGQGEGEGPGS